MTFLASVASLTFSKPFLAYLGQFSKRLSHFKHSYLSQMTAKIKNSVSQFKFAHWQSKNISFTEIPLLLSILRLLTHVLISVRCIFKG